VIKLDTLTKAQIMKNVHGVAEIDAKFQSQIKELFFQQMKTLTVR